MIRTKAALNIHMLRILFLLLLTGCGVGVIAQKTQISGDSLTQTLDKYFMSANQAYKLNGCVLVAQKGNILLNKAYGYANIKSQLYNDTLTRFPILSITKSFTSTTILKLQEEGKLSVKDKLSKYFPDYQYGKKITIENLLTHSSGISNFTDIVGEEDSAIINHPIPKARILEAFMTKPLDFEPGSRYSYNNSGYFLLGIIIEKVTGQSYQQIVRKYIFTPLGMSHSGFDFNNLPQNTKAQGHSVFDTFRQKPYKYYDSTYAYSAGSIYSTGGDLYKFAKAIASNKILTPNSWRNAFKPRLNQYGYGWNIGNLFGRDYVSHDGGYPGFMSSFVYFPKEDITIIILNNFGNYGQNVWATGMGVASILFNLPFDFWQPRTEQKVDETTLKQYVGLYKINKKTGLRITYNNGQLHMKGVGNSQAPELPLLPESKHQFFLRDFNTTATFIKDGDSFKLIIHEHGNDSEWKVEK